jgi:hypothetical protein
MLTILGWLKSEFGDVKRDGVQIKWMLAVMLLLQIATLVKLLLG